MQKRWLVKFYLNVFAKEAVVEMDMLVSIKHHSFLVQIQGKTIKHYGFRQ
jgi:hypothetical protein